MKMFRAITIALLPIAVSGALFEKQIELPSTSFSNENGVTKFEGSLFPSEPGAFATPMTRHRIALPVGVDESSVDVSISNILIDTLQVQAKIARIGEDYDSDGEVQERNSSPIQQLLQTKIGRYRQLKFLECLFSPVHIDTITGVVTTVRSFTLSVNYDVMEMRSDEPVPSRSIERFEDMVDDGELLKNTSVSRNNQGSHLMVITTDAIKNGLSSLDNFIEAKESRGFRTSIVTEEMWGGGFGDAAADNLHQWLKENYLLEEIDYLLIIGDPSPETGDIPMKMTYPYYGSKKAPTDFYYSDLTSNWNSDGDSKFGELSELDEIDAIPDVVVGRIPLYNEDYNSVDYILQKTMAYEQETSQEAAWRENMMLVMDGYYGSEGYEVGEAIHDDLSSTSWGFYRMYNRNIGGCDDFSITEQEVTDEWKSGTYGIVSWLTHGKKDAAMHIMDNYYAQELNDDHPSFVMMGSCLNGKPEYADNLAYTILKKGAVGVVSGSETTIFKQPMGSFQGSSYNHGFIHSFTTRLAEEKPFIGDALAQTKEQADMGCWKNYCAFNLYGDPTVGLAVSDVPTGIVSQTQSQTSAITVQKIANGLSISGINGNEITASLFNLQGQLINSSTRSGGELVQVQFPNIAAGSYLVKIEATGFVVTEKINLGI